MSINIFGSETKDSIKVGYVDPNRGAVEGVSICEANDIAKANPGTRFFIRTGDGIKYININQVNKLTPNDLKTQKGCPGINLDKRCGDPPKVNIIGGGGVGASANAIVGTDGSIIGIDVIRKGYGYKYPPIVEVVDRCGLGNGVVARAILDDDFTDTVEIYDDYNQFENYEICPPSDPGYGTLYGPDGKALGAWNPRAYLNLTEFNNQIELKKYQDLLTTIKNPWFTSRKNTPLKITPKIGANNVYSVEGKGFDSFLNNYGISPVPLSKDRKTDYAGTPFTIEWELDFPYDGEYTFSGVSLPNVKAELFFNNKKVKDLPKTKNANPLLEKRRVTKGKHKIGINLINENRIKAPSIPSIPSIPVQQRIVAPAKATVEYYKEGSNYFVKVDGDKDADVTVDFVYDINESTEALSGVTFRKLTIQTEDGPRSIERRLAIKTDKFTYSLKSCKFKTGKKYKITIEGSGDWVAVGNNGRPMWMSSASAFTGFLGASQARKKSEDPTISPSKKSLFLPDRTLQVIDGKIYDLGKLTSLTLEGIGLNLFVKNVSNITEVVSPTVPSSASIVKEPVTSSTITQEKNIFNTKDFINKKVNSGRTVWKASPVTSGPNKNDRDFFNQYGVTDYNLPLPDYTELLKTTSPKDVTGYYILEWNNISFPSDTLVYEMMSAASAELEIIDKTKNKVIFKFDSPRGSSATNFLGTKVRKEQKIPAGNYQVRVTVNHDLGEIITNRAAVALKISSNPVSVVDSVGSWEQNPTAVALTILAPPVPQPRLAPPRQEGRCPEGPIWTTRSPNPKEKWSIANSIGAPGDAKAWSSFMNSYAISPIQPSGDLGTDGSGNKYENEWDFEAPQNGYYGLQSTVDNSGKIYIDNKLVMDSAVAGGPAVSGNLRPGIGGIPPVPATSVGPKNSPQQPQPSSSNVVRDVVLPKKVNGTIDISLPPGPDGKPIPFETKFLEPSSDVTSKITVHTDKNVSPVTNGATKIIVESSPTNPTFKNILKGDSILFYTNDTKVTSVSAAPKNTTNVIESSVATVAVPGDKKFILSDLTTLQKIKPGDIFKTGAGTNLITGEVASVSSIKNSDTSTILSQTLIETVKVGSDKITLSGNAFNLIKRDDIFTFDKTTKKIVSVSRTNNNLSVISLDSKIGGQIDKGKTITITRESAKKDAVLVSLKSEIKNRIEKSQKVTITREIQRGIINLEKPIQTTIPAGIPVGQTVTVRRNKKTERFTRVTSLSIYGNATKDATPNFPQYPGAENENPRVTWSFNKSDLPPGVSIQNYRVLLENLTALDTTTGKPAIHWDITVPVGITTIPAGVTDPKTIWGENGTPQIGKTYLGNEPKNGLSPIGYAGPQPKTDKIETYQLTVVANLIGSDNKLVLKKPFQVNPDVFSGTDKFNGPGPGAPVTRRPDVDEIKYIPKTLDTTVVGSITRVTPGEPTGAIADLSLDPSNNSNIRFYSSMVGIYTGTAIRTVDNYFSPTFTPQNRNPFVRWEFPLLPEGVTISSYQVILQCTSGTQDQAGRVHWDITVPVGITSIPFNASSSWINDNNVTINNNYLMNVGMPIGGTGNNAGVSDAGYSGPQPLGTESVVYRLSVTAVLSGTAEGSPQTRITSAMRFNFINPPNGLTLENSNFIPINPIPAGGQVVRYTPKKETRIKKFSSSEFNLTVTPPQASDPTLSSTTPYGDKVNDNKVRPWMVGNAPKDVNPNQYGGAENKHPQIEWKFEVPKEFEDIVKVKRYEILLEDLDEIDKKKLQTIVPSPTPNQSLPQVHWNILIPPDKTKKIPSSFTDINVNAFVSNEGIEVQENYVGRSDETKQGKNELGYSGPQPPRSERHEYKLSLTAHFEDNSSLLTKSITKSVRFKYVENTTLSNVLEGPKGEPLSLYPREQLEIKSLTPITQEQLNLLNPTPTPPSKKIDPVEFTVQTSSLVLEIYPKPKDGEQKEVLPKRDGVAPLSMIGNAENNPNKYEGASNVNPEVTWSFGQLPVGVAVSDYRIILEDLSNVEGDTEETEKPTLHWDITVPAGITTVPAGVSDVKTIWGEKTPVIGETYLGGAGTNGVTAIGYAGPQPATDESHTYRLSVTANLSGNLTADSEKSITQSQIFFFNNPNGEGIEKVPADDGTAKKRKEDNLELTYTPNPEVTPDSAKTQNPTTPTTSTTQDTVAEAQKNVRVKLIDYLNKKSDEVSKRKPKNAAEQEQKTIETNIFLDLINGLNSQLLNTSTKVVSLISIVESRIASEQKLVTDKKIKESKKLFYYKKILTEIGPIENPPSPVKPPSSANPPAQRQTPPTTTSPTATPPQPDLTLPGKIFSAKENNPQFKKIFLSKGKHKIRVEINNNKTEVAETIQQKIFSTKDWLIKPSSAVVIPPQQKVAPRVGKATVEYYKEGSNYFVKVDGDEGVDVTVDFSYYASGDNTSFGSGVGFTKLTIDTEGGPQSIVRKKINPDYGTYTIKSCKFKTGKKYKINFEGRGFVLSNNNWVPTYSTQEPTISPSKKTLVIPDGTIRVTPDNKITDQGRITAFTLEGYGLNLSVKNVSNVPQPQPQQRIQPPTQIVSTSKTAPGVVYEGPTPIANYSKDFISPVLTNVNARVNEEIQGKTWKFKWTAVNFPEKGEYNMIVQGDDRLIVKVDGRNVGLVTTTNNRTNLKFKIDNPGKKTVELELTNNRVPNTGFYNGNFTGAFVEITKSKTLNKGTSKSWRENPLGISAVLVPPPCPKRVRGKGPIKSIPVVDGGGGFPNPNPPSPTQPPQPPGPTPTLPPGPTQPPQPTDETKYPAAVIPVGPIIPTNPGINYVCSEDQILINGISVPYTCNNSSIIQIEIPPNFPPITKTPEIQIITNTGIGLEFTIPTTIIRDPVDIPPQQLIQVTDLVGLKQTGYINGRPYYGSIFYQDGVPYAGLYFTPGPLIRVYATLQESIDAQVTTPPSAIQRQGSDVSSNNPRLNIPGTPQNLI